MVTVQGTVTSSGWIINPVHAAGLSPAQYKVVCVVFGSIPAQFCFRFDPFKNLQKKNTFSKTFMIFSHIFLSILINIDSFFIYRKNTNAVLKYPVFVKTLKKMFFFIFMHTAKSLKEKSHHIFIQRKFKKYVLACILTLITSLLKSRELGHYLKKHPKNIIFSFNIRDYEFIRKTYSRY